MPGGPKFSPDGGDVVLRLVCGVQQCRLEVSDEGVGIPLAERGRLFRRFSRASSAAGIGGTGLGLAISMSIAEAHDGTIEVADRRGPGTTFVVTLPLRSDASKSAGEAHPGAASRRPPPATGPERRLLAVEELAP
jgi:signal transduction histidine kinase